MKPEALPQFSYRKRERNKKKINVIYKLKSLLKKLVLVDIVYFQGSSVHGIISTNPVE